MTGGRRLRLWTAAAAPAIALSIAACGATPPQAPLAYAKKLDEATSGISTACGEADQLHAFPGADRTDTITLEATASSSASKLAEVFARNPAWIYQGESVRKIVHDSAAMLDACGLRRAEAQLLGATTRRR